MEDKKRSRTAKKEVDPRKTVGYYSMYQNFGDVLSMMLVCFLVLIFSIAIVVGIGLLIISDHPTFNMLNIITTLAELLFKFFLSAIQWVAERCAAM